MRYALLLLIGLVCFDPNNMTPDQVQTKAMMEQQLEVYKQRRLARGERKRLLKILANMRQQADEFEALINKVYPEYKRK